MMLLRLVVLGIGAGPIGIMSDAADMAASLIYFSLSTAVRKGMEVAAFNTVQSMEVA